MRHTALVFAGMVAGLLGTPHVRVSIGADVPAAVLRAEQDRIDAISKAMKSSVAVFANGGRGGGSAVVISPDGFALTNFHVVKPAGAYMQCAMADGRLYDAVLVAIDPTGDVAMIKLTGRDDFVPAEMGDSDQTRPGDWCFAIGNPFLLATDFQLSASYGLVSGTHRYQPPAGTLLEYTDCLQTDAAINPGNSGGPLFDAKGRLIGINGRCSFEKRGRVNVGVGYAISINQIKKFLGYLHSGRIVDHATLGATVATDDQGHVAVSNILPSADAYRRGLRFGDQIVSFGGRSVSTVNGFKNVLGIFPKGWRVPLTYSHDGQQHEVLVRLAGVHTKDELIDKVQGKRVPAAPQPRGPKPQRPGDQPQPGTPQPDKPQPDGPQPDGPQPRGPNPKAPANPHTQQQPPPEHIAKMIEPRRGFANYFFNRQRVQRVWKDFSDAGALAALPQRWTLAGTVVGGGPFQIELGPSVAAIQLPARRDRIDVGQDLDQQLLPLGTGGLLPALHLWQQLLRLGPAKFGDVYYLGTAPVPGKQGLHDVLVGTRNVVEVWTYFDPKNHRLAALELYPETNVDPCELHFDDYRPVGGPLWPHRIDVRFGNNVVLQLQIDKITFDRKEESQPKL